MIIATRILDASEVDLSVSEAKKIGAELVASVRDRSHAVLEVLPSTLDELREVKGLVIDDVLRLLSLSLQGYQQLQVGGQEAVLAVSRLHRLCKANNVPEKMIPDL